MEIHLFKLAAGNSRNEVGNYGGAEMEGIKRLNCTDFTASVSGFRQHACWAAPHPQETKRCRCPAISKP